MPSNLLQILERIYLFMSLEIIKGRTLPLRKKKLKIRNMLKKKQIYKGDYMQIFF